MAPESVKIISEFRHHSIDVRQHAFLRGRGAAEAQAGNQKVNLERAKAVVCLHVICRCATLNVCPVRRESIRLA